MAQEIRKSQPQPVTQGYADPFAMMRSEFDRVLDTFLGRGFGRMPALFGQGQDFHAPTIDIKETDGEMLVEAELPGIAEEDVAVTIADGVLTIKGEKKSDREEKKQDYHLTERSYGKFERSFRLPATVDADKVSAAFDKGVLKVTLPKRPGALEAGKSIPIGKA